MEAEQKGSAHLVLELRRRDEFADDLFVEFSVIDIDPSVLERIQNQELQSNSGSDPIKIAEIFRALSDGIFNELASPPADGTSPYGISTIRRNLQREYVKRLSTMVLVCTGLPVTPIICICTRVFSSELMDTAI